MVINNIHISNKIAEALCVSKTDAKIVVSTVIKILKNSLVNNSRIEIRGFGVFKLAKRKSSIRRNPKTGAKVIVPPKNVVTFKPAHELIDIINF